VRGRIRLCKLCAAFTRKCVSCCVGLYRFRSEGPSTSYIFSCVMERYSTYCVTFCTSTFCDLQRVLRVVVLHSVTSDIILMVISTYSSLEKKSKIVTNVERRHHVYVIGTSIQLYRLHAVITRFL